MVARPEFLNHFIFNSDYPIDKVVWLYEAQATSPNTGVTQTINIDVPSMTGSKLPIFVKGAFTVDDWSTALMMGANVDAIDSTKAVSISMDWTNSPSAHLQLSMASRTASAVGKTVKYRLWGVCREDMRDAIDYAKNQSVTKSKLIFDTGRNYPRLYKDGIAKSGDVVEHNLGKIPYVDFWCNNANYFYPDRDYLTSYWSYRPSGLFGGQSLHTRSGIRATDKTITFTTQTIDGNDGPEDRRVWYYYRIYA